MDFDIFCSLALTPRDGELPTEATVLREFVDQAVLADGLGFGCVWVAESHFSLAQQRFHTAPVMPHWSGEMGLNADICLLASHVFARTSRIDVGSAIMNIVAGGPIAAAERVAGALAWHGLDEAEHRRLNIGFASGRFDYINRTLGIAPRNEAEAAEWSAIKPSLLREAGEIFVRLLRGEAVCSGDITPAPLHRCDLKDATSFEALLSQPGSRAGADADTLFLAPRWPFERTELVPHFRPELLQLYAGTQIPELQEHFNAVAPVRVFNLSITRPEVIEQTHDRMRSAFHPDGGPWERAYMPRTVFVFVNADPALSPEQQRAAALAEAEVALSAYWSAMEGTIDPARLSDSAMNALIGNPDDIVDQLLDRFDPNDRIMLWFDFFRSSGRIVLDQMAVFAEHVRPAVEERLSAAATS